MLAKVIELNQAKKRTIMKNRIEEVGDVENEHEQNHDDAIGEEGGCDMELLLASICEELYNDKTKRSCLSHELGDSTVLHPETANKTTSGCLFHMNSLCFYWLNSMN